MAPLGSDNKPLVEAHKRIKELEKLFAKEIQKVADLLKENQKLEKELEDLKHKCQTWRRYYEKLNGVKKIHCNRQAAMVEHGEISVGEIVGS